MNTTDLKDLQRELAALKQSELRATKLLESLTVGIGYYDPDGKVLLFNQKAASNMGGKPEDFVGRTMFDLFGKKDGKFYFQRLKDALKCDDHIEFEDEVDLPGGKKWFYSQFFPMKDHKNKITGVQIISADITRFKTLEKELTIAKDEAEKYLNLAGNIFLMLDDNACITMINQKGLEILGYERDELIGKNWFETCLPNSIRPRVHSIFDKLLKGNIADVEIIEDSVLCKNGETRIISWHNTLIKNEHGDVNSILSSGIDVTERTKIKKDLIDANQALQVAQEMAKIGYWNFDIKTQRATWSDQMFKVCGYKKENGVPAYMEQKKTWHPDDWDMFDAAVKACQKGTPYNIVVRIWFPDDKSYHYIHTQGFPKRDENGKITELYGTSQDITEMKKAELEIKESEFKYRNLIDSMMNAFSLHEMIFDKKGNPVDYRLLEVNPAWENVVGLKATDVLGKTIKEFMPDIEKTWLERYAQVVKTGIPDDFEEYNKATGKYYHVFAYRPEEGKFAVFFNDITERKNNEKEILDQKNFLDSILTNSPLPTWISDKNGTVIRTNPALMDTLNLKEEEVVGVYNILHDKSIEKSGHLDLVQNVFYKQHSVKFTLYWEKELGGIRSEKGGRNLYLDATLFPISDKDGSLQYVVCQWIDITENKQAEKLLKEAHLQRENILNGMITGIYIYDFVNKINSYTNPAYTHITGWDVDEINAMGKDFVQLFHPEDLLLIQKHMKNVTNAKTNRAFECEYRFKHKKGHWIWCLSKDTPFERDEKGNVIKMLGSFSDITEIKEAEAKLKQSEEKYRFLIENQNDLIVRFDPNQNIILFASPNYLKIFGKKEEDVINKTFLPLIHEDDREKVMASIASLKTPPHTSYHEERAKTVNGWRWFGWSLNASVNDSGKIEETVAVGRDITDRKQMERQVEELSRFPSENPNPVLRISKEGNILFSNSSADQVLSEISDNNLKRLNAKWTDIISQVYAQNQMQTKELMLENKVYMSNIVPISEHGYVNLYLDDITEERKAETEKAVTQNRYTELVNTINSGVAIYKVVNDGRSGDDYIIQDFNRTALNIENLGRDDVVGKSLKDLRPNIDDYGLIDIFRQVWKTGEPAFYPAKIYTDEKYANYYENRVFRLPNHEIVAVYDDVTEREQAAEKIRKSEERFELAMKATSDGIYDWNLITNEIYYSPGWKSMLGYEYDELPNDFSVWETLTEPEDVKRSWEMQQKVIKGELDRFEMEFKMKHKDGHWVDILSRAEAVFDENGKAVRMIGTHMDISDQKKYEQELNNALNKAKESDRLKSAFLANMSHEIRTPMNGILGFSNLLKQADNDIDKRKAYIDIIQQSGKRMLNTINDLIDISRIESGQVEFNGCHFNLNKKLEDLYQFFKIDATNKGLELSYEKGLSDENSDIYNDADKIHGILSNFMSNAIKFTDSGMVRFGYKQKEDQLEFYVQDTGRGIPEDAMEKIFDRFVQADLDLSRGYEGSGLGLSISKAFADVLQGEIRVESEPGKGSTFFLSIPFTQEPSSPEEEETSKAGMPDQDFLNVDVLIAEDDEASILYLETLLSERVKKIYVSTDGEDVIKTVKAHPEIELVLMDVKMPVLDGFSATKEIRKFNKDIKIIAQTAYAMEEDNEKAMQAGCDGYISKPIDEDELFALINKLFQ